MYIYTYTHIYICMYVYIYTHTRQEGISASAFTFTDGNPVDFMYKPQIETAKGKTWIGEDGVSTYKLDDCDTTAAPYMRDAPVQVLHYVVVNIYLCMYSRMYFSVFLLRDNWGKDFPLCCSAHVTGTITRKANQQEVFPYTKTRAHMYMHRQMMHKHVYTR
jgi:hypothetical protein